ncbi:TetR family transcriptional regulator C-terminal domain-containing protein [Ruegeria lacuscaerulensis]|uniref:TetR family transcriptional regulator C-terminal domain-containing protein n=1 Tax=Ruegeria lacuscaerulensis TaxID=55218 RepID=UPI00147E0D2D|nr:TetR family transcriptional regulator C-terminal domain-containing protein [Ruegeria lacuscaerulensis]
MSKITATAHSPSNARELSKSQNRKLLIEAAADAIHKFGIRGTTAANIHELSGLSRGMVNLHFGSKEKLLLAVAEELSARYSGQWQAIAGDADLSPAEKLVGIIEADFDPYVLNARDVAIWFAFRAEALSNPDIYPFIDSRDQGFRKTILELCHQLKNQAGYEGVDAKLATDALIALLEGLWTDYHLHSDTFKSTEAVKICLFVLQTFFPKHFARTP